GEFVLVVEGCPHREAETLPLEEGVERVLYLQAGGMRLKDAARQVAGETGLSKNDLYRSALEAEED
ncbi:MAG: 16S rRNA (cytidine(1402)-2'-O)-methyltransferase, partial [Clostridiales bacterium]|nr:16S rRNA (cytidine(1402)-2'-O)-methyltransferase [Clostridiales bacterium]